MKIKQLFLITIIISFFYSGLATSQTTESARPWIGVSIDSTAKGILVTEAIKGTPAFKSGIKKNDIILSVDDKAVETPESLISQIVNKGIGYTVKIKLLRNGKKITKKIKLVARPEALELVRKERLNKKIPNFEAIILQGQNIQKSQKKFAMHKELGKVTLIEFWATWCGACAVAHPRLIEFAKKYKNKINVLAISEEKPRVLKRYLKKFSRRFPKKENFITYVQSADSKASDDFMANSIPMFVLIDKNGIVKKMDIGAGQVLEDMIRAAVTMLAK